MIAAYIALFRCMLMFDSSHDTSSFQIRTNTMVLREKKTEKKQQTNKHEYNFCIDVDPDCCKTVAYTTIMNILNYLPQMSTMQRRRACNNCVTWPLVKVILRFRGQIWAYNRLTVPQSLIMDIIKPVSTEASQLRDISEL